jgi:hypothetical protein
MQIPNDLTEVVSGPIVARGPPEVAYSATQTDFTLVYWSIA